MSVNVFSYVIEHDLGFAPNPFHGVCTLACCKPDIRKKAEKGDLILGIGAARPKLSGHVCFWMRVDDIISFDEYWNDPRYRMKRPNMRGSRYLRYGDNIYHREAGEAEFRQEYSFHSLPMGLLSVSNLRRDTGKTDKVLIGNSYAYWGRAGIMLPPNLQCFDIRGPGHKCRFSDDQITALLSWIDGMPERGFLAEPAHWQFLARKRRRAFVRADSGT